MSEPIGSDGVGTKEVGRSPRPGPQTYSTVTHEFGIDIEFIAPRGGIGRVDSTPNWCTAGADHGCRGGRHRREPRAPIQKAGLYLCRALRLEP